jgi:probable phosphoglycerate mutase
MPRSTTSLFPENSNLPQNEEWVTAHCDGGARGNPGPAGYGAILQDESGAVLAKLSEFLGNRTNNFAEYSGLLGCLQWALDHGHTRLRVVSDSELMVKQIQGKYKVNSPDLRPLWEESRKRISKLEGFEISHTLRHKNKVADQLANDAMDRGTGRSRLTADSIHSAPAPPSQTPPSTSAPKSSGTSPSGSMLRGFTRGGTIHLLGGAVLPDGVFVKVIPE